MSRSRMVGERTCLTLASAERCCTGLERGPLGGSIWEFLCLLERGAHFRSVVAFSVVRSVSCLLHSAGDTNVSGRTGLLDFGKPGQFQILVTWTVELSAEGTACRARAFSMLCLRAGLPRAFADQWFAAWNQQTVKTLHWRMLPRASSGHRSHSGSSHRKKEEQLTHNLGRRMLATSGLSLGADGRGVGPSWSPAWSRRRLQGSQLVAS